MRPTPASTPMSSTLIRETSGVGVGDGSPDGLGGALERKLGSGSGANEGCAATGLDGSSTKISFAASRAACGHGAGVDLRREDDQDKERDRHAIADPGSGQPRVEQARTHRSQPPHEQERLHDDQREERLVGGHLRGEMVGRRGEQQRRERAGDEHHWQQEDQRAAAPAREQMPGPGDEGVEDGGHVARSSTRRGGRDGARGVGCHGADCSRWRAPRTPYECTNPPRTPLLRSVRGCRDPLRYHRNRHWRVAKR